MGKAITGIHIGTEICDALGLDASKVQRIELIVGVDEAVVVNVIQVVYLEEMKKVNAILTEYNLVPKEK